MEYNDIYDRSRRKTGRVHLRGTPWKPGEYGLVVCAWIYDGQGRLLLTRRASGKTYAGTWENSGGAALAGETSRQAIAREVYEETGIQAGEADFEYLGSGQDEVTLYDYYCLKSQTPLEQVVLRPGETDAAQWVSFETVHTMIERREICDVIGRQFLLQEQDLRIRQDAQNSAANFR
ncbi:MAG TPA: NUDIX domain-containing protein [Candidatus Faecousia intestinigallinarum]|nr:NUDIX domain-containing protein [Candidatus Faecousia intestinigallinarum]